MLIAVERLLIRVRQVPTRADELIALGTRVREMRTEKPGREERAVAARIREVKTRVSAALSHVTSCGTCATGKRPPRGAFAGGDCCSGITGDLFSEEQLAPLVQAGTTPRKLRAPRTTHAGCAFRGDTGCTLDVGDRPARCIHYTCWGLRNELRKRGELVAMDAQLDELKALMEQHTELRNARIEDELIAPLEAFVDEHR
ncbi:hypothetical protein BH11MYX2_BH11MYX2_37250 [soil metagenome]